MDFPQFDTLIGPRKAPTLDPGRLLPLRLSRPFSSRPTTPLRAEQVSAPVPIKRCHAQPTSNHRLSSMLVSCLPWRSSVFISLTVFLGFGQIASSTTTATAADCAATGSTSAYLSDSIPPCALPCVQEFIRTQYAAGICCSTDLDCLCRTNTTSGLTIGEVSLACIVGSCPSDIVSTEGSVGYAICNDVSGALPETHGAITATRVSVVTETTHLVTTTPASVSAESTSGASTALTTVAVSSTPSGSTLVTTARITATATAATTLPITALTTFPSTVTLSGIPATSAPTASSAAAKSTSLSSPAVIGVSIASGISVIFLVAVAILFCGRKLRRRRLQEKAAPQSFEIGGAMSEPPDFTAATFVPQPWPPTQPSQFPGGTMENEYDGGAHFQQFPSQPLSREQQGPLVIMTRLDAANANNVYANKAAMSPETDYNGSPQSQTSQRTLSRLLPERTSLQGIGIGIVPEPLRVIRQPPTTNTVRVVGGPSPRPTSEATVFDEDEQQLNSNDIFGPPLNRTRRMSQQRIVAEGRSSMRAVGLPAGPRAMLPPLRTGQEQQNPYDGNGSAGYYSYQWDKEAVPIPNAPRRRTGMSPAQQYNNSGNWNNTASLQRNFSRLGNAPRSLTTPTKSNAYRRPYSRHPNGFDVAPADPSYETLTAEDDWTTTERSKLSIPYQVRRQSKQQQQQQPPRLSPVSERIPLPTKSPLRYPAIPRSAAAAIVPATAQGMRKSHVAEVYYEGRHSASSMPPPPPPNNNNNNNNNFPNPMDMVYELGPGQRSRSASPSPSVNSSLLAKRRGEGVADKMEAQFRSGVQPKPTISRKVVVAMNGEPNNTAASGEVQSPPSAKKHNITPTRRGEDLYLRVD
ncbi:hypothetical protein EYB25_010014 [Talaromyces marneffei]|nr:hypothetical protein EYB25_010014 [Talaromyces marneffei]